MKKEIKFRAWHKSTKTMLNTWPYKWTEGIYASNGEKLLFADNTFEFSEDKKECNRATGKSVFLSLDGFLCGLLPVDDKTTRSINYSDEYELMQFTGIHDRNGKEVYEGDIIKNEFGKKVIKWDDGGFYCDEEKTVMRIYLWILDFSKIEVIGNIYENPKLIGE